MLVCPGPLLLGLRTLRGKIKLIGRRMLRRAKMEAGKRVKIKTIRNLARQSDPGLRNQVLSPEIPLVFSLFLVGVVCGSL